jgi:hypothetical protein
MNNISINSFYFKYEKLLKLIETYTGIKNLFFILKACRLKPYEVIYNKNDDLILNNWWFDEYGCSLKLIKKSKKLYIINNDLSLNKEKILCTDLYGGLSIDKTIKISKFMYLVYGKDKEDFNQDFLLVSLLGIDNYLRTYLYLYKQWTQVSSLLLGFKNLKRMMENLDLKYFKELKVGALRARLPCDKIYVWLSSIPISDSFNEELDKKYNINLNELMLYNQ